MDSNLLKNLLKRDVKNTGKWDGHTERVCLICKKIASAMHLSEKDTRDLLIAAKHHDDGKVYVEDILSLPRKLTPQERKIVNLHSEISYILNKDKSERVREIIRNHHNHATQDLLTQILIVADVKDALSSKDKARSYQKEFLSAYKIMTEDERDSYNQEIVKIAFLA